MLGRGRYAFGTRYLQGAFRGWGYEDFTAGTITTTSVTLSDNENGTDLYGFETSRIISGSAVVVLKDYPAKKAYTGITRLFSTKVEVSTHTSNTAITLSGVPHSNWGDIRIYYLYDYPLGVPQDYQIPSKAVSSNLFAELQDLFLSEEDLSATAPITYSSQTIALDYDTDDFLVSGSSLTIKDSGVDHDSITNTHNLTTDIDHDQTTNFLANEHIDWTDTTEDFLTTGTLGAGAITGTSFIIGGNTLNTTEWGYLDGLDQALKTTDSPSFATGVTIGNLTLANGSMTDSSGAIDFGNENITLGGSLTLESAQAFVTFHCTEGSGREYYFESANTGLFGIRDADAFDAYRLEIDADGYMYAVERLRVGSVVAPTVTLDVTGVVNSSEHYEVDGTQVVGNRVVDERCDDAINSGDATTDGVIDALRDAMIAHGLIAAA